MLQKTSPNQSPNRDLPGVGAIGPAILLVLVVAMVIAARAASRPAAVTTPTPLNLTIAKKPGVASPLAPQGPAPRPALVPAAPVDEKMPEPTVTRPRGSPVASVAIDTPTTGGVTLTGCVARDAQSFKLKNTEGADAPKARSWKSGFLARRAATIELRDSNRQRLVSSVGQRVRVTGTLTNREMQVQSLQRVSGSCS